MNIGVYGIYIIIAAAGAVILLLLSKYHYYTEGEDPEIYDAILNAEELERHGEVIAKNHAVDKKVRPVYSLESRLNKNFKNITVAYRALNDYVDASRRVAPAAEWLLDNFYIIEEQVKEIKQNLTREFYAQLPRLKSGPLKGYPRVYAIALELVSHTDGRFDEKTLISFIKAYQRQALLTSGELWAFPLMVRIALTEHIRSVCDKIMKSQEQWDEAEQLADMLAAYKEKDPEELLLIAKDAMKQMEEISSSFGEHLLNRLKKHGMEVAPIIRHIDNRLMEQRTSQADIAQLEHNEQAARQMSMGNAITSLRFISGLDWREIFESLSKVEKILRKDPAGIYASMDFHSRDYYRHQIEKMAKAHKLSEIHIARKAIECAVEGEGHVGYYLLGKSRNDLRKKLGLPEKSDAPPTFYFLGSIILLTAAITAALIYYAYLFGAGIGIMILVGLGALIPASDIAVSLVNWIGTHRKPAAFLPKLELRDGIPGDAKTMVVIPTLLPNAKRVGGLLEHLEEYYLANREENLYFALAGDFKDASEPDMPGDLEIIEAAKSGIRHLNEKYGKGETRFYFFHRKRLWNPAQNKWMGWERKRGALMELNELLRGAKKTSYNIIEGDLKALGRIKYIITIDADTKLPMEAAKKLIGTIMHPLNRAVIDEKKGIVTEGYGLLQPRISVDILSANATPFTRVFAGQGGIDIYTTAVSDVYQDNFGEGIFTGKGIYEIDVFEKVLKNAIPENTVLSHDLLEGSYVRTGLVTDIELIDGYPARYNAFSMRLHRWVRGDWQLIRWLSGKVRTQNGKVIKNPLPTITKWKMLDNMRRSLAPIGAVLLILLGFSILPGNSILWLLFTLAAVTLPILISLLSILVNKLNNQFIEKACCPVWDSVKTTVAQAILIIAFLPYQAHMMLDAIMKTLGRVYFTKKNMLEWVTAADMELGLKNDAKSFWKRMWANPAAAAAVAVLTIIFNRDSWAALTPLLVLWAIAPYIAYRMSTAEDKKAQPLTAEQIEEVRRISRKTWSFFEDFVGAEDNYLPPDNYQEDPPNGIAHRTSPTNIGLLLVSTMAARDLGYISTFDMMERIEKTLTSIEKLEKWKGHLYNWYDTTTLKVLRPYFISTVDSGNFVGYLMTLKQGLMEYLKRPLVDSQLILGLRDTLYLAKEENPELEGLKAQLELLDTALSKGELTPAEWKGILDKLAQSHGMQESRWGQKLSNTVNSAKDELHQYMPWLDLINTVPEGLLENKEVGRQIREDIVEPLSRNMSLGEMADICKKALSQTDKALEIFKNNKVNQIQPIKWLTDMKAALSAALQHIEAVSEKSFGMPDRVQSIADATSFLPLFDQKRKLFSIGYNKDDEQLIRSYYDLLASEARQASFIAIARGEVGKEHWFMLNRTLTQVDGYKGLVSWTGTMFEYVMPLLNMRNYENTLLDETYKFVVRCQQEYGRKRQVPWGVSESGYFTFDFRLNYQYRAFGIPSLGLKRGLINDTVVAPYATLLALPIDPVESLNNLMRLKEEGMEGPNGFYEAIDYTPERLSKGRKSSIVKSYMTHHQGMGFLALTNYIHDNIMQTRFHSDPMIKAAELLLQEKIPAKVIFAKDYKEKVEPYSDIEKEEVEYVSILKKSEGPLPEVHVLSNGNYSVAVADNGSGYSRHQGLSVTRWREDALLHKSGMFFYVQDTDTNKVWSTAFSPNNVKADKYRVIYSQSKAEFLRTDGAVDTQTEIVVSPEDDVEIRKISLTNHGQETKVLEITSYFEAVLAPQSSDVAHPAFSNLFIKTEYISKYNSLVAVRRPREHGKSPVWGVHILTADEAVIGGIQYETDRSKFIGRGRTLTNPIAMEPNQPLSNTVGPVIDPIMSLRARVRVQPGQTVNLAYITGVADSRGRAYDLMEKYHDGNAVDRAFGLAWTRSQVELQYLGFTAAEMELYRHMLSQILYLSPRRRELQEAISRNQKGQSGLWAYGVSGDIPIVLVFLNKTEEVDIVKELLKAHEFWRIRGLLVDLVIINEDEDSYTQPLFNLLQDIVSISHARDMRERQGGVFIKQGNNIPEEDKILFMSAARVVLRGSEGPLATQIKLKDSEGYGDYVQWKSEPKTYEVPDEKPEELLYYNGYGGFSPTGKEYVIRLNNETNTPLPWVNVISNGKFGFQISESGASTTWSENSRENKLTTWPNDPVMDTPGEVFYMRDEDTGEYWSMTPQPLRQEATYTIRHGFGYTGYTHTSHGIRQELLEFCPMNDPVKLCVVKLNNLSNTPRTVTITYFIKPVLGVNEHLTSQYITTEAYKNGILLIRNNFNSDFADRVAFMDVNVNERTYTGDRREFLGNYGSLKSPEALKRESLSNTVGAGLDPCGAMQVKIQLKPNKKQEIVFMLGQAKSIEEVSAITNRYRKPAEVEKAYKDAVNYWAERLSAITVKTPDNTTDLMVNGWLLYQTIVCRLWARSALYQSGGAFGFRDQLQDAMSLVYLMPKTTRKQILYHAEHQFIEGDVQHWWHPVTKGIRTKFSDDLMWLPYVTADYLQSTDDWSVLDEVVSYLEDDPLGEEEDERYNIARISQESSSLYEHCIRAIERGLRFGTHGIPLMGSGDWNDGMSTVGNKGKGESCWMGWFMYSILMNFVPICKRRNDDPRAERYEAIAKEIAKAMDENAWDGSWYRRAYFDNGVPLGSAENTECKIDSLAQSWSIISGAGRPERVKTAMESLEHYLIKKDEGLVLLLTPPFDNGDLEPGYIKGYLPGVRENGGQYTHASTWVVLAYAKMGNGDKAWETYNLLNPINHANTQMEVARYKVEPYVMAADVYAVQPHIGRGGWTWYTGASGWMYRVAIQHILGFNKYGSKLVIDPCIPKNWPEFTIEYKHENTKYTITVKNPAKVSKGVKTVTEDGTALPDNTILLSDDGKPRQIEVVMG